VTDKQNEEYPRDGCNYGRIYIYIRHTHIYIYILYIYIYVRENLACLADVHLARMCHEIRANDVGNKLKSASFTSVMSYNPRQLASVDPDDKETIEASKKSKKIKRRKSVLRRSPYQSEVMLNSGGNSGESNLQTGRRRCPSSRN